MMNKRHFLGKTYHYKYDSYVFGKIGVLRVELEKNEKNELRDYLIKNNFPQSFIDLLEDCSINDLLIIIKK